MKFEKKIKEFRTQIKNSKNPIMFFDSDTDGATSYFQLKNKFKKIKGYPMPKEFEIQEKIAKNLIKEENDLIVIFDIPNISEEFIKLTSNKQILWMDHHLTDNKQLIKKYNINYLNPVDYDKNDNRPCTYFAYLIANLKKNLPFVALGSVADFFLLEIIKDLHNFNKKEFNALFQIEKKEKKELLEFIEKHKFNDRKTINQRNKWIRYLTYSTNVIDIKNLIDFLFKLEKEEDIQKALETIRKSTIKEIRENINSEKGFLYSDYSQLKKDYKLILQKAIKQKHDEDLFLFEYSGKTSYTKTLSEEICYKFENTKVIGICFNKTDSESYSCSFRGNNYNVNELVVIALKNLNGRGGGHPFAAGVKIEKKDFLKFKKNIKQLINNTKNL